MTNEELGQIVLDACGAGVCEDAYGTTVPHWVGFHAINFGDIDRDGTLN